MKYCVVPERKTKAVVSACVFKYVCISVHLCVYVCLCFFVYVCVHVSL